MEENNSTLVVVGVQKEGSMKGRKGRRKEQANVRGCLGSDVREEKELRKSFAG